MALVFDLGGSHLLAYDFINVDSFRFWGLQDGKERARPYVSRMGYYPNGGFWVGVLR